MMQTNSLSALSLFFLTLCLAPAAMPQQRGRPVPAPVPETAAPAAASDLATIARDLRDKAQDTFNYAFNQRQQVSVDQYMALAGFAGSAIAYSQMATEGRDGTSLRNWARRLVTAASEIDGLLGSGGSGEVVQTWGSAQEHVLRLSNYYSLNYRASRRIQDLVRNRPPLSSTQSARGRFRWRGRVDGSDYILLQGDRVTIRHIEYGVITDSSYDLPAPLPQAQLQVGLTKLRGRGTVEIARQPSASNGYTLTVFIEDPAGGSDYYEFEITW